MTVTADHRTALDTLTTMPEKSAAYAHDTYYLETADQLATLDVDANTFAHRHGLLFLKPDAIAARAVEPTLEWLQANSFRIVSARKVVADRHLVRALWYFQWNIASPERRRLAELLVGISSALLLVVTDTADEVPTSVRLTDRKGPTAPSKRRPGELRHLLGGSSYLLNMVHTADEPADVLRELGVYLTESDRAAVISEAVRGADRSGDARQLGSEIYTDCPPRSFDRAAAEAVLREQLRIADLPAAVRDSADGVQIATTTSDAGWAAVILACWQHGVRLDPWATLVVGSAVLPMRTPTGTQTLGPVGPAQWHTNRYGGTT